MDTRGVRARMIAGALALALALGVAGVMPATAVEPSVPRRDARAPGGVESLPNANRVAVLEDFEAAGIARPAPPELMALDNNEIPGDPIESASLLPWPLVLETLDASTDPWDAYSFTAYPGDQIYFWVDTDPDDTGSATLDAGVVLWDSTAVSVGSAVGVLMVADRTVAGGEEWLCYTVPDAAASTTYYVGVNAQSGGGIVDYGWGVTSRSDGNIPGVTLPPSGHQDHVISDGDMDDVYAITLGPGTTLSVQVDVDTLDPTYHDPLEVWAFRPGSDDIWTSMGSFYSGSGTTVNFTETIEPGEQGTYYIDVYSPTGGSAYEITWSVTGPNLPGAPMPAPGSFAFPSGDTVFYQDLRANEYFQFYATDPGNNLQVWLFGPNTVNINTAAALDSDASSANPKELYYRVPPDGAGRYYVHVESAGANNSTVSWYRTTDATRIAGGGRYETAAAISQQDFPDGADTVVIASGEGFPDALSAASLAGAYDAPVLLVTRTSLPAAVRNEIIRLGATRCFIVGGAAVVNDSVRAAIDAVPGMRTPVRVAGGNRYATSAAVADTVFTKCGLVEWMGIAAMARGDDFADALALAPVSWAGRMPILLTDTDYLPLPIDDRLPGGAEELPIGFVVFAGGEAAISDDVYDYIESGIGLTCARLAGGSRYETAVEIADWSAGSPWLSYEAVGLATGQNFPDALGGGPGIAKVGGVLLMTESGRFTAATRNALLPYTATTHEAQAFGGAAAISDTVLTGYSGLYD